jgi:sulfatase-like protein
VTSPRGGRLARAAAGLSVLATPWLIFIGAAHEVYVRNQDELGRQLDVLRIFWAAFAVVLLIGILLRAGSRAAPAHYLLWAYYLLGVFFLVVSFLRGLPLREHLFLRFFDSVPGVGLLLACFGLALILCARHRPEALAVPLGAAGLLIAASDVVRLAPRIGRGGSPDGPAPLVLPRAGSPRGNVYHVIFDALQGALFEDSLERRDRTPLQGFVTVPGARSISFSTRESLPHIFTGRRLLETGTAEERLLRAFNDPAVSFLEPLRRAGVATVGFLPRSAYPPELRLFDAVRFHDENVRADDLREMNRVTMRRLWLFSAFPLPLASARWRRPDAFETFDGQELRRVENQRTLSYNAPIASYLGFRRFLEQEADLPDHGRYTLVHVLIPHGPWVLGPECGYNPYGSKTGIMEQYACTARMLLDLVETLRRLGRFDDALVVVQGDHGVKLRLERGRLVEDEAALLKPFLAVKPPGAKGPLRATGAESTLLDLAPTIYDWLGTAAPPGLTGGSLLRKLGEAPPAPQPEERPVPGTNR